MNPKAFESSYSPYGDNIVSLRQSSIGSRADLGALIAEVAAGSQQAMTSLYDASSNVIFGLLLRILSEHATAEEVLLDVYMQVWRQATSYDAQRGSPLAWILTIARSRAIDRLRSDRQEWHHRDSFEILSDKAEIGASLEEAVMILETRQTVCKALETLPEEQREVIELAYYGGLSHSEIALQLGQPLGTVKTRTRLGMMKLRDILQPRSREVL